MEAILKFDLPDDKNEFILATQGKDYWSCLWDIEQTLRKFNKHGFPDNISTPEALCEEIRSFINESIDLYEVE